MNTSNAKFKNVDEYISSCQADVQVVLKKLRLIIKKAAPKAAEQISYGMPFYEYGGKGYSGRLLYFAAFKKHISLFIPPGKNEIVPNELKKYHISKATYQFPLDKLLPFHLIEKTIKALVKERDVKVIIKSSKTEVLSYHTQQTIKDRKICELLFKEINIGLPRAENKVWHGHPVWFLEGNPIAGYSKQKKGIRLMFWSGASFEEPKLNVVGKKFKDASIFYNTSTEVDIKILKQWLKKSIKIQWDYKNIVKRKGKLERLK